MQLTLSPGTAYGKILYYAKDEVSEGILSLMRRKSFTRTQVKKLVDLGFKVSIQPDLQKEKYSI